jgi:hypothetical protein
VVTVKVVVTADTGSSLHPDYHVEDALGVADELVGGTEALGGVLAKEEGSGYASGCPGEEEEPT